MSTTITGVQTPASQGEVSLQKQITCVIDGLLNSLPRPESLSSEERRGIVARYAAVLEGNFIYWMTATLLSVKSEQARSIILENLGEEVRDCHPEMMRKFAIAAGAFPRELDAFCVHPQMRKVRLFLGRLSAVPNLLTMAFFEGFIQRFMSSLADLAQRQGSQEMEYTDVHGVCDIAHSQELFHALDAEIALSAPSPDVDLFEGVRLLRALIETIVHGYGAEVAFTTAQ